MARYRASRLSPFAIATVALVVAPQAVAERKHPAPIEYMSMGQGADTGKSETRAPSGLTPQPNSGATHDEWRGPVTQTGAVNLPSERQKVAFSYPGAEQRTSQPERQYASIGSRPRAAASQSPARLWPAEATSSPLDSSKAPAVQTLTLGDDLQAQPTPTVNEPISPKAATAQHEERGLASWYGENFDGQPTANGEVFDMNAMTGAHRTLPLPSLVQVVNEQTGKEVVVRINDRGPFIDGRVVDLSKRAAVALGISGQGVAPVTVRYLGPAPALPTADPVSTVQVADSGQTFRADAASQRMSRPDLYGDMLLGGTEPTLGVPDPGQQVATPAARTVASVDVFTETLSPLPVSASPSVSSVRRVDSAGVSHRNVSPSTGGIYLQVGSFADIGNAQSRHSQVKGMFPVKVEDVDLNGASYFRVLVGPFATRDDAERARIDIRLYGISDSFITQR